MPDKGEVLHQVSEERSYQNKIGNRPKTKTVGEEILLCEALLHEARQKWVLQNSAVGNHGYVECMNAFRRIAANAVRIMQVYGTGTKEYK